MVFEELSGKGSGVDVHDVRAERRKLHTIRKKMSDELNSTYYRLYIRKKFFIDPYLKYLKKWVSSEDKVNGELKMLYEMVNQLGRLIESLHENKSKKEMEKVARIMHFIELNERHFLIIDNEGQPEISSQFLKSLRNLLIRVRSD